jgi:hypothetical protein
MLQQTMTASPKPGLQDDRRQSSRLELDVRLRMSMWRAGSMVVVYGTTVDLSCDGMCAMLATDIPEGDRVEVDFVPPFSSQNLHATAVVRTRNGFRYGLALVELTPAQRDVLSRTCAALGVSQ